MKSAVAIVGAGPYGLSIAAHLAAKNVPHRIFGYAMSFWSQIADAGGKRYLKSYCFGTNISAPSPGSTFADYSRPRGLETFEPCSIRDFAAFGRWFQGKNVPWLEPLQVEKITKARGSQYFTLLLSDGQSFSASHVVIATGLSCFAYTPSVLAWLPRVLAGHTSEITSFAQFEGRDVAVIGGGQSALEVAALLLEAGARPQLLVRAAAILWNKRILQDRGLWQRIRSPISGLGTGPKAWVLTNLPGALHYIPERLRIRFLKQHLPPEGAWWLRDRVEGLMPIHFMTTISDARERNGRAELRLNANGSRRQLTVDYVVAGSGYQIDIESLHYLDPTLRRAVICYAGAPRLNARFESSVNGLRFVGPASAMSFGPLFRFVVGAEYTARVVSADIASEV